MKKHEAKEKVENLLRGRVLARVLAVEGGKVSGGVKKEILLSFMYPEGTDIYCEPQPDGGDVWKND